MNKIKEAPLGVPTKKMCLKFEPQWNAEIQTHLDFGQITLVRYQIWFERPKTERFVQFSDVLLCLKTKHVRSTEYRMMGWSCWVELS